MTIRDLTLEGLERAINALLALDPVARERLAGLHGKTVRIQLSGIDLTIHVVPGHDGRVRLLGSIEGEPDATLTGSPLDLVRASDKEQGHAQLFAGNVRVDGDTGVAQRFSDALGGLDIDWEEQLSKLTGDVFAHELGRGLRGARRESERVGRSMRDNLSEYLTEEARVLPHRYEVEDFIVDVDALRDDADRLEARIARLEKQKERDGDS